MKKHLIFLSFVVGCYCSPANAMFYLVYKAAEYIGQKSNLSSESNLSPNDLSPVNVTSEPEKKDYIIDVPLNNGIVKPYQLKKNVEIGNNNNTSVVLKEEKKEIIDNKKYDYSPDSYYPDRNDHGTRKYDATTYRYQEISFEKNLNDIFWKLDLYKKGEKINLDMLTLELKTMMKMRSKETITKHQDTINLAFEHIRLHNKK